MLATTAINRVVDWFRSSVNLFKQMNASICGYYGEVNPLVPASERAPGVLYRDKPNFGLIMAGSVINTIVAALRIVWSQAARIGFTDVP